LTSRDSTDGRPFIAPPGCKAHPPEAPHCGAPATKRIVAAQVTVCQGCCCGRVDRGRPALPVDWLKAEWKARRLLKRVQLTISGCLGPCDVPNIATISSAEGVVWLGGLATQYDYELLVDWATRSADAGAPKLLPAELASRRLDPFRTSALDVPGNNSLKLLG
jgi:hypothetical protein